MHFFGLGSVQDWLDPVNVERSKAALDMVVAEQRWLDMVFVLYYIQDTPE